MSDLISRQSVINAIANTCFWLSADDWNELIECINSIPSVENKGEWKRTYLDHVAMGERPSILYCSVCCQCIAYPTNFCPNCGAKMKGGE